MENGTRARPERAVSFLSGADMLQLFQRSQRRFHEAVLFLVAFNGGDEFSRVAQGLTEGFTQSFGLR